MIIWWRRTLIAVSATAAVLASFVFLRDLAIHAGWPDWTAPLLPLSLDALAAAALTEYRRSRSRTAAAVSAGAIAASVAGNAASHLISTGMLNPGWAVVTAVGSVPAITVGLTVHIFTSRGETSWNQQAPAAGTETPTSTSPDAGAVSVSASSSDTTDAIPANAPVAVSVPPPPQPPTPVPSGTKNPRPRSTSSTAKKRRTDAELLQQIRSRGLADASLSTLTSELSVSKTRAQRLREQLTENSPQQQNHDASRSDQEPAA